MISDKQAEILGHLLLGGEIKLRRGGMYNAFSERVDGRSLIGLNKKKYLGISGRNYMPSIGHLGSPVFYDTGVTKDGREALRKYLASVSFLKKYNTPWMKKAEKILEIDQTSEVKPQ